MSHLSFKDITIILSNNDNRKEVREQNQFNSSLVISVLSLKYIEPEYQTPRSDTRTDITATGNQVTDLMKYIERELNSIPSNEIGR